MLVCSLAWHTVETKGSTFFKISWILVNIHIDFPAWVQFPFLWPDISRGASLNQAGSAWHLFWPSSSIIRVFSAVIMLFFPAKPHRTNSVFSCMLFIFIIFNASPGKSLHPTEHAASFVLWHFPKMSNYLFKTSPYSSCPQDRKLSKCENRYGNKHRDLLFTCDKRAATCPQNKSVYRD